ncbi:MAG: GspH/FimT family protein, partial [Colwellia sp.]|nr:GspH/FimT family protein [Colwellia sp.]
SDVSTYSSALDQLLKVSEGIDENNSLTWDGGGSEITFDGDGNARSSGTFTFCGSSANDDLAKALILRRRKKLWILIN